MLLALTLFRLVLNTATTRLILTKGSEGTDAAGAVIATFGEFVAGNSLAVGVIIFAIITIIQFVVITKGSTRIAEVAARFTLDGMPGKQMAIDADLNAGIIDDREARRRREEIASEADFYGAMDGASKFVRGDAIAGLVITFVNVLGGLYVGMFEGGLQLMESLEVYTKLSIGDGLASQIPAFIISVGAGMLVTRSTGKSNMGEEVFGQLFAKPVAMVMSAAFLSIMLLTPLPKIPLVTLATGCGTMAFFLQKQQKQAVTKQSQAKAREIAQPPKPESHLGVDALELRIGYGLVKLVDRNRGGDLLDRITSIRKQIAIEMGLIVPPVRIRDNGQLDPNQYVLMLRGEEIARGEAYPDKLLAIDNGLASEVLNGLPTKEPAFGLSAWWVDVDQRDTAEQRSYTVVEPTGVLATHLTEIIKRYAAELLTRGETQKLIDHLKSTNAGLVEEVIPNLLRVADVQAVLQSLLRERVPVRDLEVILETLGDWAPRSKDVEVLTEYVRNALARTICAQYRDPVGKLHCVSIDPMTEDLIQGNIQRLELGSSLTLPPEQQSQIAVAMRKEVERATPSVGGAPLVVLCSPQVRMWLRRMIESVLPQTPVIALNEVVRGVEIQAHGVVGIDR
jgi:flagellar biosynthesis protein FlhA